MKEFIFDVSPIGGALIERVSVELSIKHDDDSVSSCGKLEMDRSHWSMFRLILRCAEACRVNPERPAVIVKAKGI